MRIVAKIILTLGILVGLNELYQTSLFIHDVEEFADQYLHITKIKDCDVMYISASSNFPPTTIQEKDPRKISQFLGDHLPSNLRVEAINKPASHAGIFYDYLQFLPDNADVKTFVITMNLRSFGPDWVHSDLEPALRQSSVFYNQRPPLVNRTIISLKAYDDRTIEEHAEERNQQWQNDPLPFPPPQNTVSNWCAVEKWGDWQDPKRQLADQFIKQYGFVIDENNPRVQDFDRICDLAEKKQWKVVFNILGENMQLADSLAGSDLSGLMRQNTDWLIQRYTQRGYVVVDNLESVNRKHFTDKHFPTEHYDEVGRRIIANNVATKLIPLIKDL